MAQPVLESVAHAPPPLVAAAPAPPELDLGGDAVLEFERFAACDNELAAHIVAGRLECEGVPAIVESTGFICGLGRATVWVARPLAHRARWVMAWPPLSDSELAFLATGEL